MRNDDGLGGWFMAKIYWRNIKNGARTYASVPDQLKEAVKLLALADLEAGLITQEEYSLMVGD